ncbi:hypothetical protein PR202_gb27827 [Eleusine coracana subsp. coracana]|uniref:MAPK kinase substrate protein n=1 Tax=Eleusine coracana subsp. coracana TaxID=191504 RepID=A0AAV5FSR4_ELECO|nr:hypothetical protein QOZ80_6AG0544260 [Eleusine coracana subsp. coracana]GJN38758.1 hypothetical protein PR202_gb27827 [Eleusine coracana subsp. coracana]
MAGLQRSATTFRRSGSSGLVWDERFLTEADSEAKATGDGAAEEPQPELRHSRSVGSIGMLRRVGAGGDGDKKAKLKKQKQSHQKEEARSNQQVFRTKDVAPDVDPPSPRVSGCILCSIFGSSGGSSTARRRSKPRKK